MKTTAFPNARYIIPREWFDNLMYNNYLSPLNNSQFLNPNKTMLNQNIDERKIVLIIYEIMNYIHSTFLYDVIIEGKVNLNDYGIVILHKVKVMGYKEFIEPDFRTDKKYLINNSYVKYPQFQIEINNAPSIKENKIDKKELSIISKSDKKSNVSIVSNNISNSKYYYNPENNKLFVLDSFEKKYLEPIGINNKSNYCYMISCFQILLSIPEMNYYFLYKKYKKPEQKTLICDGYFEFISLYNNNKNQLDIPPSIYSICHSFFQKGVMNDCEEFFILFLKSIQEELNMKINNIQINNNKRENDIDKIWNDYRKDNDSFIDGLFTGLLRSTVICNKCQNEFYNYEPFMDLAVPLPKKNKSILHCLNIYFDCESLDCNYHCEKCNLDTNVSMINII